MSAVPQNDPPPNDRQTPSGAERADWLVGPEEGLAAEVDRAKAESGLFPRPSLVRRQGGPVAAPAPVTGATRPTRPTHPGAVTPDLDAGDGFERGPGHLAWEPGTPSVPRLPQQSWSAPAPTHDFPMDDAEERARAADFGEVNGPPVHEVVAPEAFDVGPAAAVVPWWVQVLHTLRTDWRIQALMAAVLLVLATVALWPHGEQPMSIGHIRRQAASMDGVSVLVAGRVAQVFPVGGGYAYYLQDGRDTLVVFTRVRQPQPRERVTVRGTMSTGYLDGQSTLALFESNEPRR